MFLERDAFLPLSAALWYYFHASVQQNGTIHPSCISEPFHTRTKNDNEYANWVETIHPNPQKLQFQLHLLYYRLLTWKISEKLLQLRIFWQYFSLSIFALLHSLQSLWPNKGSNLCPLHGKLTVLTTSGNIF